jgi:hypothetical protein
MAKPANKRPAHSSPKSAPEEKGGKRGGKPQFDNTDRGVMFPQDKEGNEARPDYTGTADIRVPKGYAEGQVFKVRIAGWIKVAQSSGDEFLSLKFQEPFKAGDKKD